jgi:DNA polymerase III alpha subunit (gram-positive type)
MNSPKLCFIDVETTGIDRNVHNIFQISARITSPDASEVLSSFDSTFRPLTLQVQADALDQHGYSLDDLASLPTSSSTAYSEFVAWLSEHVNRYDKSDKLHFVAYNAKFDAEFVRSWFEKHDDAYFGSYFWNPPICVMMGAAWFTKRVRSALPNFKLSTLCQCAELGWDEAQAHDASYDIDKTIELYRYLDENLSTL